MNGHSPGLGKRLCLGLLVIIQSCHCVGLSVSVESERKMSMVDGQLGMRKGDTVRCRDKVIVVEMA